MKQPDAYISVKQEKEHFVKSQKFQNENNINIMIFLKIYFQFFRLFGNTKKKSRNFASSKQPQYL